LFAHSRIHQIDQLVRGLVLPATSAQAASASPRVGTVDKNVAENVASNVPHPEFRLNEFGTLLKGHEAHARDRLHGTPTYAHVLWSDIMLYELWRGVQMSDARPVRA